MKKSLTIILLFSFIIVSGQSFFAKKKAKKAKHQTECKAFVKKATYLNRKY